MGDHPPSLAEGGRKGDGATPKLRRSGGGLPWRSGELRRDLIVVRPRLHYPHHSTEPPQPCPTERWTCSCSREILPRMGFAWPGPFQRIPDDDWTRHPVETLARKYDTVEHHGWYHNLDRTVTDLSAHLRDGHVLVDYSGGTGILVDRLLHARPDLQAGMAIVDASPKFLRLALEKFRADPRIAFRLIRYLKEQRRLEYVDEVFEPKADVLVSTNAIHLYYDLGETLQAWHRALKLDARIFVQSGNIRNPAARAGEWIIDETVDVIHRAAMKIARSRARYAPYREILDDATRMREYDALRAKYFIPVRPLEHYLAALTSAGFSIEGVSTETIQARVDEWRDFVSVYHEGVLGWVGGAEKIESRAATAHAVSDRLALIGEAMSSVFGRRDTFPCCWTYVTARRA